MHLVHAWCMFLMFVNFHKIQPIRKQCLRPSPEPHFLCAHAIAAFNMLLWLMTFCKTLTPVLGFCGECLQNPCETHRTACNWYVNLTCYVILFRYHISRMAIQGSFMLKTKHFCGLPICRLISNAPEGPRGLPRAPEGLRELPKAPEGPRGLPRAPQGP